MSLAWIVLLALLILERNGGGALTTGSLHYGPRGSRHSSDFAQRRSRRIVRITRTERAVMRPQKTEHAKFVNNSISTSGRTEYNMWQVLRADGRANLYLLFFTIYISYLVYVLF
ncbi:uncharacterized protein LOC108088752 [Drosophila ficusphila]|uniref:uncharacterized protein LOC108088752 n=1 Tax=Drosophila ficusphila TaxID=30025 RepID=UPI0007E7B5E3|nr:uncharacterized protein LOC108088752 [Drosophila ficusphila]